MRFFCFLILALSLIQTAGAQSAVAERGSNVLTESEQTAAVSALLTPDGQWFAYLELPVRAAESGAGPAQVVVRSTSDPTERRYGAGELSEGAGTLSMSKSGRWLAFQQVAAADESQRSVRHSSAVFIELASGRRIDQPNTREIVFLGDTDAVLLNGQSSEGQVAYSLALLVSPDADSAVPLASDVTESAANRAGTRIVWATHGRVELHDVRARRSKVLDESAGSTYRQLTWSNSSNKLAVLRTDAKGQTDVIVFSNLDGVAVKKLVVGPGAAVTVPRGYEIALDSSTSPTRSLRAPIVWRENDDEFFIGLTPASTYKSNERESDRNHTPPMAVWHWADPQLPTQKQLAARPNPRVTYLGVVSLAARRLLQLEDAALNLVEPNARGRHVLSFDWGVYDRASAPNTLGTTRSIQFRDYYLTDLRTGKRRLIVQRLPVLTNESLVVQPRLSPDGSVVIYQDHGDYIVYDIANDRRRNVTAMLPTKFWYPENPQNLRQLRDSTWYLPVLQGWSDDGAFALISDYYDVWALPLHDRGLPKSLTTGGARGRIAYAVTSLSGLSGAYDAPAERRVDLLQPIYFRSIDLSTGRSRLSVRNPDGTMRHLIAWEDAATDFFRAGKSDVRLSSRRTSVDLGSYHLRDASWRVVDRLAPNRDARESPGARLLAFTTAHGDQLNAVLHFPAGYVPGRSYPTIVSIYERQASHVYGLPGHEIAAWLDHGYAVLEPDIQPRLNEAGKAAVEAVTAAVEAAVETGIVDRDRLALTGHSYGGYETFFIVTQTDMFKAAVPQAGYTNLLSQYGLVYQLQGVPSSKSMESEQPYLAGPWWDHWDAFVANSPVFHAQNVRTPVLIAHGNADKLVPFSGSVEFFNTLRRIGKPVVLLEYDGIDHAFEGAVERDLIQRMLDFFGHFLKGEPPPRWWQDGVSVPAAAAGDSNSPLGRAAH